MWRGELQLVFMGAKGKANETLEIETLPLKNVSGAKRNENSREEAAGRVVE